MNVTAFTDSSMTISSRELAALIGKGHNRILSDIDKLIIFYNKNYSAEKAADLVKSGTYTDAKNHEYHCFHLTKTAFLDFIEGYTTVPRSIAMTRWAVIELQERQHQIKSPPLTYLAALKALVAAEEQKEAALKALAILSPGWDKLV